ncbi:PEGA domain-containing protein [Aquisalimonas sp.]|uniref:PEGA domain-containing protein n=1 Tax=Aquisalimonas sp. TaxID=1872621 RepID=UPI0025BB8CAB|nr:PEGA domain-containing protein [Aquisalimonas sp.]
MAVPATQLRLVALVGAVMLAFGSAYGQPIAESSVTGSLVIACRTVNCEVAIPALQLSGLTVAASRHLAIDGVREGVYEIRLAADGQEVQEWLHVCEGTVTVDVDLSQRPPDLKISESECRPVGHLEIDATVDVAGVKLNKEGVGTWDLSAESTQWIDVVAGTYHVEVHAEGFEPHQQAVEVVEGDVARIEAHLRPLPGEITLVIAPGDATVSVEDNAVEQKLLTRDDTRQSIKLQVPPGRRVISIESPNHRSETLQVDVRPGQRIEKELALEPMPASLTLAGLPEQSRIALDGEPILRPSWPVALDPGAYVIQVEARGYQPLHKEITLEPGENAVKHIELSPAPVRLIVRGFPLGATVSVDGSEPERLLGSVYVPSGESELTIFADGYVPASYSLSLEPGRTETLQVSLTRTALMTFAVTPEHASVLIGGNERISIEEDNEIAPGTYDVLIQAEGHHSVSRTVTLLESEEKLIEADLSPLPANVVFDGLPVGATVRVNDDAPKAIEEVMRFDPGEYRLWFEAADHSPMPLELNLKPGETRVVRVDMVLEPATLVLEGAPAGTLIRIGESSVQSYRGPLEVEPGQHKLWVAADGYRRRSFEVAIEPGEVKTLDAQLTPRPAELMLAGLPADATVRIDDGPEVELDKPLVLEPGTYRLRVTAVDHEARQLVVTLEPGEHRVMDFELEPDQ